MVHLFAIAAVLVAQQQRLFFVDGDLLNGMGYDTSLKAPASQGLVQFSPDPSAQNSRIRSFCVVTPKVLDDAVLRGALTHIQQFQQPDETASESLRLIRISNLLQPLGKLGAIEALLTYDQAHGYPLAYRLSWLADCVFVPPDATPTARADDKRVRIPAMYPGWPTFPVLKLAGIPFVLPASRIRIFGGDPQFFCLTWQIVSQFKDWSFWGAQIVPSDDPFVALDELNSNTEWKSLDWHVFPNQREYGTAMREDLKSEILRLTASVFDRAQTQLNSEERGAVERFDEFHKEFLRMGGHWDPKLQMYVARSPGGSKTR